MTLFEKPEALIFDIDGTLFQTESILNHAYYQTFQDLKMKGLYHGKIPPIEKMYACIGMILKDLWSELLPEATNEARDFAGNRMLELEIDGLKKGLGKLYLTVYKTLEVLQRKGYRMFVASNGVEDYVKNVVKYTGIEPFFEKVYSAGEYRTVSKGDLVRLIVNKHHLESAWMIGDRTSDVEAGKKNGLTVIGCDYADFKRPDELKDADFVIHKMEELLMYL